jgi:hypothetical protein
MFSPIIVVDKIPRRFVDPHPRPAIKRNRPVGIDENGAFPRRLESRHHNMKNASRRSAGSVRRPRPDGQPKPYAHAHPEDIPFALGISGSELS